MGVCVERCGVGAIAFSFVMRAYAGGVSNVVDLYDSKTGRWSTAQLSQASFGLAATSVGTVAIFAGGFLGSKLMRIVFAFCVRNCSLRLVVRCDIGTWVFVFRDAVLELVTTFDFLCAQLQHLILPL
jgi:hypothetical protein